MKSGVNEALFALVMLAVWGVILSAIYKRNRERIDGIPVIGPLCSAIAGIFAKRGVQQPQQVYVYPPQPVAPGYLEPPAYGYQQPPVTEQPVYDYPPVPPQMAEHPAYSVPVQPTMTEQPHRVVEPLSKGVATAAIILAVVTFPVSIVWLPFAWKRIVGAWNIPSAQPAYAFPPMPQYAYPPVPQQPQPDSDGYVRQEVNLTQEQLAATIERARAAGYHVEAQADGTLFVSEQSHSVPMQATPQPQVVADDLDDLFDAKLDEV